MSEFRFFDDSNISLGILCCFRFLSNALDTRPLWLVGISFSWISLSRRAASERFMGVLGHMPAIIIIDNIIISVGKWVTLF
jgi:hypothetical protein